MSSITSPYTELSPGAQTAYAELLEAAVAASHHRTVADLKGSFASKTVKGRKYWYYQYTEPSGRLRQVFVGPDNEAVAALRERKMQPSATQGLARLARAAAILGCAEILPLHARVLQRLSEYGFFRAGGLLIGTHAFLAYGNMLGVRWGDGQRTQDVDLAHAGKSVSLALPTDVQLNAHEAIKSLEMGFLPTQALGASSAGATYLNPKVPGFRLDFLTTRGRQGDKPFHHPQLGVAMQPLRFLEFSLEDVQQAVLISGDYVVVVNVPSPARYALHKLIVFGERSGSFLTKSSKDIRQSASLLARLRETRATEVERAWRDLLGRGKGWRGRAKIGLAALGRQAPHLKDWLESA